MKKKTASRIACLILALALVCSLGACGSKGATLSGSEVKNITLKVWTPSEDQSTALGNWIGTCCDRFAELHPEYKITYVYETCSEADAANMVKQDPVAAADVFLFANDTITNLIASNAVMKIGGSYLEEVKASNSQAIMDSVTVDGYVYGIPFTTNNWYLFYDKSVFSDVSNLDAMLEQGVVSFPLKDSWYLPAFYIGNGCTLFGDGTDEAAGVDFSGDKAVAVTDYLIDLAANKNFVIDADGSGIAGLRNGSVNAKFSGSWDAASVKAILGDNMGVAALPTYTLNGQEKQMYAYAGSKAVGVNANSANPQAAMQLAVYLASEECQLLHYTLRSVVPCNTKLLADPQISSDELVVAQNDCFDRTSILQPFVSAMSSCWTPVENMGKSIASGETNHANAASQTEGMNQSMNTTGIG